MISRVLVIVIDIYYFVDVLLCVIVLVYCSVCLGVSFGVVILCGMVVCSKLVLCSWVISLFGSWWLCLIFVDCVWVYCVIFLVRILILVLFWFMGGFWWWWWFNEVIIFGLVIELGIVGGLWLFLIYFIVLKGSWLVGCLS